MTSLVYIVLCALYLGLLVAATAYLCLVRHSRWDPPPPVWVKWLMWTGWATWVVWVIGLMEWGA